MNAITQTVDIGHGKTITLETGRLAKQAGGSVVVRQGDTMVLCTAVIDKNAREGQHFFPLTVDYRERFSAGGKFPGGFLKREGRPSDKETLTSRLIDRTIRPLFPDGFRNEVQALCFVLSADPEVDADVIAGLGASAALNLTGGPFDGPTAHVRVGRVGGEWIINPTKEEREQGDFDLVVAGKEDAIVMVEGEMDEASEDDMLAALDFGHEVIKRLCRAQHDLRRDFEQQREAIEAMEYETVMADDELVEKVRGIASERIEAHLRQPYDKKSLYGGLSEIKKAVVAEVQDSVVGDALGAVGVETTPAVSDSDIKNAFATVQSDVMRDMILSEGRRIDGRRLDEVRDIWTEIDYLPRVHGSAIFTRGETQVLAQMTLGSGRDVQGVDQLFDQTDKRFYLHYNFPPFSVGEARFLRGPGRREIGHGMLAERALAPMLPSEDEFPYTIRLICDVLESNGSSSMGSVCSGSMALMAGGVPIKKPVAGIAMGMIKAGDRIAILSDILGTEDHLGDMDFKLTGTRDGITACQMDIKIDGLAKETMKQALDQARAGRLHILDEMEKTIGEARGEIAASAPRLFQLVIDTDFIGALIGPGGKNIKALQADTNTKVDIDERDGKGFVTIAAENQADADAAIEIVRGMVTVPEVGEEYEGTVRKMLGFGAILEVLPGKEGMLHVSEMAHGYVENPEDVMQVGDKVKVQLIEVRDDGKLRFSRKPFLPEPTEEERAAMRERRERSRSNGDRRGGSRGGGRGRGGNRGDRRN
ncbi:MAG: polyribonucleotide nucleotidyltransferase [Bacteroidota bacterium]